MFTDRCSFRNSVQIKCQPCTDQFILIVHVLAFMAESVGTRIINSSVVVLGTVTLPCYTPLDMSVEWRLYTDPLYTLGDIDEAFKKTGRFSVSNGPRHYNLTIDNVSRTDAGRYSCFEKDGLSQTPTSEYWLRVLGKIS